jgi:DNA-directed RNA polymerase subunit alpha
MEVIAETGKGYVPAAANRPADAPIGCARPPCAPHRAATVRGTVAPRAFPVDALYSPVRQDGQAALSPGQG